MEKIKIIKKEVKVLRVKYDTRLTWALLKKHLKS